MEMSLPMYTLKDGMAVDTVTFATPLSGLYQPVAAVVTVSGDAPPPPAVGSAHLVSRPVVTDAICSVADTTPPVSTPASSAEPFPHLAADDRPGQMTQQQQQLQQQQHQQHQQPTVEGLPEESAQQERQNVSDQQTPDKLTLGRGLKRRRCRDTEHTSSDPGGGDEPEESGERTPRQKRPRIDITVEQKRQICLYHSQHAKATAQQVVDYFRRQWGITVGRSTIASVIGNKDKWLSMAEEKAKTKRARTGQHEQLEERLHAWYTAQRTLGFYITREQLFAKAKEIGRAVSIPATFAYSKGWLQKFQARYNFRITAEKSKSDAASKRFVQFKRKQLERDLEEAVLADVFCFAEFPLLHGLVPQLSVSGPACASRPLSVCLCPNMTGSVRLPPLVVGRAPSSGFSSGFSLDKLLMYRSSARGRLTDTIFSEWLYSVDERMRRERRNILLLVGATSCNVERNYRLSNVRLRFFSTIEARCPIQQGIKTAFKAGYRLLQCEHLLHEDALSGPDLRSAIYLIRESWLRLPDSVIVAGWAASGVLPERRLADAVGSASDGDRTAAPEPVPAATSQQPAYYYHPQPPPPPPPPPPPHQHQMEHQHHAPQHQEQMQHHPAPQQQHYSPADVHQPHQFFHAVTQEQPITLATVGAYDPSLGQTYVTLGSAYIVPEQTYAAAVAAEQAAPAAPAPAPLPEVAELVAAAMRRLQTQLCRLPIPAADLASAEWLLAADELSPPAEEPPPPPFKAELATPPEPVTPAQARWAADTLQLYLEQSDAELTDIDTLIQLRRRWLTRRQTPGSEDQPPPDSGPG